MGIINYHMLESKTTLHSYCQLATSVHPSALGTEREERIKALVFLKEVTQHAQSPDIHTRPHAFQSMLQQPQATLDHHILQNGSRRDVDRLSLGRHDDNGPLENNTPAEVDGASDGQVVQFKNLGNTGDALLEVADFLEIGSEFDEGGGPESALIDHELTVLESVQIGFDEHEIGASLYGQEATTRYVHTVRVLEVTDSGTDSGFKLDNGDVGFALLVSGNSFVVGDDFHLELVVFNDTFDGLEVEPDVIGVEVLELLNRLEFVGVLLGHLRNLQKADGTFVVNNSTAFDVSLGLVGQLHDVLGVSLHHVLKYP